MVENRRTTNPVEFKYAIPIYMKPPTCGNSFFKTPIHFVIENIVIRIIKWDTIYRNYGKNDINRAFRVLKLQYPSINNPGDGYVITIKSEGIDAVDAWSKVEPSFELLMGIIEHSSHYDIKFLPSIEPGRSIRFFPIAPWFFCFPLGKDPLLFRFEVDNWNSLKINRSIAEYQLKRIHTIAKLFRKNLEENSMLHFIAECFRLYSQTTDERLYHRRLLGFWQVAERITRANKRGGHTSVVCNRLPALILNEYGDRTMHEKVLNDISKQRNAIVHSGIYNITNDVHVDLIKFYCEQAIVFFIVNKEMFLTINDIDLFYDYMTKKDSELRDIENDSANNTPDIKRSINNVRDYRKSRKGSPFQ
jgi:hypothetical protein